MSLTIHTHQAMGHKRGVQFGLPLSAVHPPQQVSGTLTARLTEDQDRGAGRVLRRDVWLRVSSAQEPRRGPFRSLASSNPVSNLISVANFCLRRIPALPPTVGRQSHDSCLPLCAGGILTIPPVHPVRTASSLAAAGAPRRSMRSVGAPQARVVSPLRPAAGPRAISLTAADHLGWLDCLLVMNFLIVPASWLVRFALFVEGSGCVLSLSRVTSVSEFW